MGGGLTMQGQDGEEIANVTSATSNEEKKQHGKGNSKAVAKKLSNTRKQKTESRWGRSSRMVRADSTSANMKKGSRAAKKRNMSKKGRGARSSSLTGRRA